MGLKGQKEKSKVEEIKEASRFARGHIKEELEGDFSHFSEEDLLKIHGFYQQDDRDQRSQRRKEGKDKYYFFMVRSKIPGGHLNPDQYLVHDELASQYANGTLRITSRQGFQLHGVLKADLKVTLRAINEALVTTLGACGDVERNIMLCPAPKKDRAHLLLLQYARRIAEHLAPRTAAYHEIWLNGQKVISHEPSENEEPIYGNAYLPRKFKTGIALPWDNCIDVYTQDLGLVALLEGSELQGFNVLVGGGMGMTHGQKETFPRLADPMAFVTPDHLIRVVEAIVTVQREHGDRKDRRHARLKYLLEEWGVPKFKGAVEERLGYPLKDPAPFSMSGAQDHLGWNEQGDGAWYLGLPVENGRIQDTQEMELKSGLRKLIETFHPGLRLTPSQDILLTDISEAHRPAIETILDAYGISRPDAISHVQRYAMACPALPTCGLALTEAERVFPSVIDELEREVARLGLGEEKFSVRMVGCPNGCARPYTSDIGFVGRSSDTYNVYVGGNAEGTRLNALYAEKVPLADLVKTVLPLLIFYKEARRAGERFGDFCHRVGVEALKRFAEEWNRQAVGV